MHPDNRNRTYYIVVSRSGDGADPFCGEIRRRRHAMGVKVSGSGYRSYRAAHDAGKKRWTDFWMTLPGKTETSR
jgi:hypothetical protein